MKITVSESSHPRSHHYLLNDIPFRDWSLLMLGHETNFRTVVGEWKNPQDISELIYIILSVTSIKTIRSLCWAVQISSIRKVKEICNF